MTKKKSTSHQLTYRILMGMLCGFATGVLINYLHIPVSLKNFLIGEVFYIGSNIFIASLKLLVVPLVFVSLVCGTAALDDIKKLGRVGSKTLILYLLTTAIAVALAIGVSVILNPGAGFALKTQAHFIAKESPALRDIIIGLIPTNPFQALAEANMLQIIIFACFLGLSATLVGEPGKRVILFFQDLSEIIMKMVTILMWLAPYGVFCLIARVFAEQGFGALLPLAKYFFIVLLVLLLHSTIVYSSLLKSLSGLNPKVFFKKIEDVLLFAFSTSSSNATLPVTLETAEHKLGVQNSIASFTIPLGATVNMDGTAIMQGVATVFIAQVYGVHIGLSGYLMVVLTATLASVGTAGVPGVGLITLAMVLRQVNLPVEGIGLIIGVDRLLDMARTCVNVTGDLVVTSIVAKSEKQLDEKTYYS